jgi:hypothetical protein
MSQDFSPEEELASALDEIRKNEKESSMIAMVAQTLIESKNEMSEKLSTLQVKCDQYRTSESAA